VTFPDFVPTLLLVLDPGMHSTRSGGLPPGGCLPVDWKRIYAVPMWLKISPALGPSVQTPVVALESTVISHGLPYPANLETALRLEEIVRSQGAVPATIGIIGGEIVVGLDRAQIEHLATAKGVWKVFRRDLPIVVVRRLDSATTVATTAWAAH